MNNLSPIVIKIIYIVIAVILINLIFFKMGWIRTLKISKEFATFQQWKDSWGPMDSALKYLQNKEDNKEPIYADVFFRKQFKFQYPLTSLMVSYGVSAISNDYIKIIKFITWLSILATALFVILIFHHGGGMRLGFNLNSLLAFASLGILTLLFYPIDKAHSLGQIQAWINFMFCALFYCWLRNWQAPSGILLGLMCLINPQYGLIALWGILRAKWKFIAYFLVALGLGAVLSILLFGFENNLNYFSVLSYLSHHGEAFYPNQSMNGLLNRLLFNTPILEFSRRLFPPYNPVIYYGYLLFGISLVLLAFILPKISKKEGTIWDLAIISVAATMFSPIAWEHHYGILLPIYVSVFTYLYNKKTAFPCLFILGISYFLSSNFIPILNKLAYFQYWNILVFYLFIGLCCFLLFCVDCCLISGSMILMNPQTRRGNERYP